MGPATGKSRRGQRREKRENLCILANLQRSSFQALAREKVGFFFFSGVFTDNARCTVLGLGPLLGESLEINEGENTPVNTATSYFPSFGFPSKLSFYCLIFRVLK